MHPRLFSTIAALILICFSVGPVNGAETARTHLLAIGICPPWGTGGVVSPACANNVKAMAAAAQTGLGIDKGNTTQLLNEDATYGGLDRAFSRLAASVNKNDRVIVYLNMHGGALHELADLRDDAASRRGFAPFHEPGLLVLWTVEQPFTVLSALAQKQWIEGSDMARMLDRIPSQELIVILDSCGAAIEFDAFARAGAVNAPKHQRRAVIASAKSWQLANFGKSGNTALFTQIFASTLADGHATMRRAFDVAADRTNLEARELCPGSATVKSIERQFRASPQKALEICSQMPVADDPDKLLADIELNH